MLSRPEIARTARPSTARDSAARPLVFESAALALTYVLVVALLFVSRTREFADETDNLLGGVLLSHGLRLYVDFFSSHMPLPYGIAALGSFIGATTLDQFRLFTNVLFVLATAALALSFGRGSPRLAVIMGWWAVATVFAHGLQFGEMLTAGTVAGYGIFLVGLVFLTTADLRFSLRAQVALSVGTFVALESELIAVFPLLLAATAYFIVRLRRDGRAAARDLLSLAAIVAAPHLLLLVALAVAGSLPDFLYFAFTYNQQYYAQFVMNPSVPGMLHDWEAQYRTYLVQSLSAPLGVYGILVLANLAATILIWRTRGWLWALAYYLFIGLAHVRTEGAYYLCSYFSLAFLIAWAIDAVRRRQDLLAAVAVLAFALLFAVDISPTYELSRLPARYAPEVPIIDALTQPGEGILVVPYDPYIYLAANRMPASAFPYYFPWTAADPRVAAQILDELRTRRPPIVLFRGDELVNGHWPPREYASDLHRFLLEQGYSSLEVPSDIVGEVLIRRDRAATARQVLASDTDLQTALRRDRERWVPGTPGL